MTNAQLLRNRFTDGAIDSASGPRVVVMAFDRLDRDLAGAIAALEASETQTAHELLCHAQDLVHELHLMLDVEAWEHGRSLASIYRYIGELLTRANVGKRVAEAKEAKFLLAELGSAFREAATSTTAPGNAHEAAPFDGVDTGSSRLSLQA